MEIVNSSSQMKVRGEPHFLLNQLFKQCEVMTDDQVTRDMLQEILSANQAVQEARDFGSLTEEEAWLDELFTGSLLALLATQDSIQSPLVFVLGGIENPASLQKYITLYIVRLAIQAFRDNLKKKDLNQTLKTLLH